jgi:hypothetical protein
MQRILDLPFNKFRKNIYSQNGEDGIIEEILRRLKIGNDSWCVEFGAWDGIHLSNTFNLVKKGWNAVYIEGEEKKFEDLLSTSQEYKKIIPIHAYVSHTESSENSLDNLLKKTPIIKDYELLSIDVDSYDLDIWEAAIKYSPKIVIIEINSTVPPGILWRHTACTPGNTFSATLNVAKNKGYTVVCHTGNLIFVRSDLLSQLDMDDRFVLYPELLFTFETWMVRNIYVKKLSILAKILPTKLLSFINRFR